MKQLVYLLAFGPECLEQFKVCLQGLKRCEVDIALITDQSFKDSRVKVYRTLHPIDVSHCYSTRTEFRKLIDISAYDRVWYMDCDFLIYEDIFKKYADSRQVLVCDEPEIGLWSEFFNQDLSEIEKGIYGNQQAINAGIYSAPRHLFHFFDYFDLSVKAARIRNPKLHIPEQMVLNSIFVRFRADFDMNVIYDIGFPSKGIYKNVDHFACYLFEDKLGLMKNESIKNADRFF